MALAKALSIRVRDGADRTELEAVAEIALAGWDGIIANIDHGTG